MSLKLKRLREQAQAAIDTARTTAQQAADADRDMTGDEREQFDTGLANARDLLEQIRAVQRDQQVLAEAHAIADELGLADPHAAKADLTAQGEDPTRRAVPHLGRQITGSAQFKAMMAAFGRGEGGGWHIPERQRVQSDPIPVTVPRGPAGAKALWTGASPTSAGTFVVPDRTDILEVLGRRTLTVRDLVSARQTGSDAVEYVVQTSHTNAAAPVSEATSAAAPTAPGAAGPLVLDPGGGYKPEGAWAYARRTTAVRTIAEWVPATKRALADVAQLEGLIRDELVRDLAEVEEAQILAGPGTGENLLGILNTSGIQTHAKGTDSLFDAIRKAQTKAKVVGRVMPSAIVMSPAEVEKVDTAKDTQQRYYGNGPFALGPRTIWGVPVVESEIMPAGTALLGDFAKAVLWDREQTTVSITDSHADFFIRNLLAILAEERVAFAVTRPAAFVTITGL